MFTRLGFSSQIYFWGWEGPRKGRDIERRRHPGRDGDLRSWHVFFFFSWHVFIYLFTYFLFWLLWVFIAVHGLPLLAASESYSRVAVHGLLTAGASLVAEHRF